MCRVRLAPTTPRVPHPCRKAARCYDDRNGVPYCRQHARPVREFCSSLDRRYKHNRVTCQGVTMFKKALPDRRCRNPVVNKHTRLCRTHTVELVGEKALDPDYRLTDEEESRIQKAIAAVRDKCKVKAEPVL